MKKLRCNVHLNPFENKTKGEDWRIAQIVINTLFKLLIKEQRTYHKRLHIFFWYGCTPWKPKESPKPGQIFSQITNPNPGQIIYVIKMRPKAGVMWWIVLILHNTGNVHDYNSGGVLNSLCISLEQICWFSIDYCDYLRLYLRLCTVIFRI